MVDEIITTGYRNINISWSNFGDVVTTLNTAGAGYLFAGIDFLVFFVLLLTLTSTFNFEVGLLTASFISFVIGVLFVYMGVMAWWLMAIFVGLMLFGIIYIMLKNN